MIDVIRDLHITVSRTFADEDAAALVWTIDGVWDGRLAPVGARPVLDQLARLRAARAGHVEPTWLEVLADVDAKWRGDRGDRKSRPREHAKG